MRESKNDGLHTKLFEFTKLSDRVKLAVVVVLDFSDADVDGFFSSSLID